MFSLILLCLVVFSLILLCIVVLSLILLCIVVFSLILLCIVVFSLILLCIFVFSLIFLCIVVVSLILVCFVEISFIHNLSVMFLLFACAGCSASSTILETSLGSFSLIFLSLYKLISGCESLGSKRIVQVHTQLHFLQSQQLFTDLS